MNASPAFSFDGGGPDRQDRYGYLRQCLAPEFAQWPASTLESYFDQRFGAGAAEAYEDQLEGFFGDLGRTLKRVAPVVANVAGGVAKGAMSGAGLGLPGIIGGAIAGGAGTALGSYARGPARNIGRALQTGTNLVGQFSPTGRVASGLAGALGGGRGGGGGMGGIGGALAGLLGGGGGNAASSLSSLLRRPEVQQALTALSLGPAGRRQVPVGAAQTPVPTTAIAGLLQNVAGQAVAEAAAEFDGAESDLAYMADATGEFIGDPTQDLDRATRVWDLLNQAQLERLQAIGHQYEIGRAARRGRAAAESAGEAYDESFDEEYPESYDEAYDEAAEDGSADDYGDGSEVFEDTLESLDEAMQS